MPLCTFLEKETVIVKLVMLKTLDVDNELHPVEMTPAV